MIKKNDAVVCINTTLRSSMPLTLYKKYNFTPIYIYLENKKPFVDYIAVYKEFKKKIPGLVVIRAPSLNPKDILPKLKKYNIIALMPYEESVVYADELASLLKIKGNDPKMTLIKKDKGMLNEYLEKKHIRVPKTLRSTSKNISLTQIDKFFKNKFPIIIKPVEGTGSIGVVCCNNKKEVEDALRLNNTLGSKFRVDKEMIYQECIKGTEYVVNFVSSNGKHVFTDC
jgi:predicted ATP-grasp superfamily ATP-dependent carboligase